MASSPQISLPQIPADLDPKIKEYLTALTKVITSKQIDDYSSTGEIDLLSMFDEQSSTGEINWNKCPKYRLNKSGDISLTFTDPLRDTHLQLIIYHSAAGTVTFPSGRIKWAGGSAPSLTTTADKIDIISLYYSVDDNIYYGMAGLNF